MQESSGGKTQVRKHTSSFAVAVTVYSVTVVYLYHVPFFHWHLKMKHQLFLQMQIAGLISAMMAMIVTVAIGFLLEPLPRVRLISAMFTLKVFYVYTPLICDLTAVCPGCLGDHQLEGHADAIQRNPVSVEKRQNRMCRCSVNAVVFNPIYLLAIVQCLTSGVYLQVVWVGTCLGATLLGLDIGLAVGLGVELLTVVFRIQL